MAWNWKPYAFIFSFLVFQRQFTSSGNSLVCSVRKGVRRSPVVSWRCRRVGHRCEQVQLFSAWWNPAVVYHLQTHHQAGSRHCDLYEDKRTRIIATASKSRLTAHVFKANDCHWMMRRMAEALSVTKIKIKTEKCSLQPTWIKKNIHNI